VSNILRYARKSQESGGVAPPNEDLIEQISELRKIVQKQEQMIESLGSGQTGSTSTMKSNPSTDAIASLITAPSPEPMSIQTNPIGSYARPGMGTRTVSASTLDVWGEMALGDSSAQANFNPEPVVQMHSTMTKSSDFSFTQPDVMPPR
jgi:callose synthase